MNNVIQFPGAPGSNRALKNAGKGKKVSQKTAMQALQETHQIVQGLMNTVGRLTQTQAGLEQTSERIDANQHVLTKLLMKKKELFTEKEYDEAWEEFIIKPQEEALDKHIEELKLQSAEDAYFACVIELVRKHEFETVTQGEQKIPSKAQCDYYVSLLTNPTMRRQVLENIQEKVPGLPTADFEAFAKKDAVKREQEKLEVVEEISETEEDITHPDCHYCGKDDCEFCKPVTTCSSSVTDCVNTCDQNGTCDSCSSKKEE